MRTKIILIISCVLISGCLASNDASTPNLSAESIYSPSPVVSNSLVPTTTFPTLVVTPQTVIMSPTTMPVEQYEILSPLAIKKGNITIEVVSYTITSSIFRFGIRITGLSPSQIPESSPEYTFVPVKEVEFFVGQDTPFEIAFLGGGGGGGANDDGTVTINQDFSYKLISPLPVGQKQHIIALVTLHEIFGIAEPIRFDLEIIPDEGIQG